MITGRDFYISGKVGCFVHDQCLVRNSLVGKRLVFSGILTLVLGFDIQEAGSTVVGQNLVPIVVISHCQFIKMSMAQAV